jgi:L-amino acid N-acyltransferase YncA
MMLEKQLVNYRKIATLKDGANVQLRPMTASDEQMLVELFRHIDDEDARYLRDDVRDPAVINGWCQSLDYRHVLPLMALVNERLVGQASLHFGKGPERHRADVRIFLAKDFRRRGLGTRMIQTLIELARKQDIHILVADIVTDQSKVIKAFQNLGFELYCTFDDCFMLPDGDTRDVATLMNHLKQRVDEF